jgi:hypothetical protein
MGALNKYKIEIMLASYWLMHAANTIRVSRKIGYYPPRVREQAQIFADSHPYPWPAIFIAWTVLAIITIGIYLILRKAHRRIIGVMIYSASILLLQTMIRPTDIGGVDYAIAEYIADTFLIALFYGIFVLIKKGFSR